MFCTLDLTLWEYHYDSTVVKSLGWITTLVLKYSFSSLLFEKTFVKYFLGYRQRWKTKSFANVCVIIWYLQEQFQDSEFIKFAFCNIHSHEFVNKMQISIYMWIIYPQISKRNVTKYIYVAKIFLCSYPRINYSAFIGHQITLVGFLSNIVTLGVCEYVFLSRFCF